MVEKKEGLLLKDEKGNAYFIRPEMLELLKVAEQDTNQPSKPLGHIVHTTRPEVSIISGLKIDKPLDPETSSKFARIHGSTVMCPW